jgi:hypothetical protein
VRSDVSNGKIACILNKNMNDWMLVKLDRAQMSLELPVLTSFCTHKEIYLCLNRFCTDEEISFAF